MHCSSAQLLRSGGEATLEKIGKNAEGASQLGMFVFFSKETKHYLTSVF